MFSVIHLPDISPHPYTTFRTDIADDFRFWGYRVQDESFSTLSLFLPSDQSTRPSIELIWLKKKIEFMPQSYLLVVGRYIGGVTEKGEALRPEMETVEYVQAAIEKSRREYAKENSQDEVWDTVEWIVREMDRKGKMQMWRHD